MRIGLVDVDTSHPQNWIPILRDLGHEVVGICDAGDVHPAEYVRDLAAEHAVPALYGTLDAMVDDVDCAIVHACDWDRHVDRARPFVEAGKAALLDKPVVGNLADAQQLLDWAAAGHRVTGGSSLRYAAEVCSYLREAETERGTVHTAHLPRASFRAHTAECSTLSLGHCLLELLLVLLELRLLVVALEVEEVGLLEVLEDPVVVVDIVVELEVVETLQP